MEAPPQDAGRDGQPPPTPTPSRSPTPSPLAPTPWLLAPLLLSPAPSPSPSLFYRHLRRERLRSGPTPRVTGPEAAGPPFRVSRQLRTAGEMSTPLTPTLSLPSRFKTFRHLSPPTTQIRGGQESRPKVETADPNPISPPPAVDRSRRSPFVFLGLDFSLQRNKGGTDITEFKRHWSRVEHRKTRTSDWAVSTQCSRRGEGREEKILRCIQYQGITLGGNNTGRPGRLTLKQSVPGGTSRRSCSCFRFAYHQSSLPLTGEIR